MTQKSNPEIEVGFTVDENVLALLNHILEQNEMILRLNEQILRVFEPPRFLHKSMSNEELMKMNR